MNFLIATSAFLFLMGTFASCTNEGSSRRPDTGLSSQSGATGQSSTGNSGTYGQGQGQGMGSAPSPSTNDMDQHGSTMSPSPTVSASPDAGSRDHSTKRPRGSKRGS